MSSPGRYYWIPASLDTFSRGLSIGVKHRRGGYKTKGHLSETLTGSMRRVELADRTLYFPKGFTKPFEARTTFDDVDEVLDLDISTNTHLLKELGLNFVMVNAFAIANKYSFKDFALENQDAPHILADSGGFQLTIGTEDWLDPNEIIEKQNTICDIGVVLDIPIKPYLHRWFLPRAAKIQVYNNRIFKKKKAAHLESMNAFHGVNPNAMRRFREVVEQESPEIKRCAIGGLLTQDIYTTVFNVLAVLLEGRSYDQYHVLGISGLDKTLVFAYMAAKGLAKVITADSSKHIQLGINKKYSMPDKFGFAIDLGDKTRGFNKFSVLPCSCRACSLVKYLKAYTVTGMDMLTTYHNLAVHAHQVRVMNELMHQPKTEILAYLAAMLATGNVDKLKAISQCLDIIDYAADHSVDKAMAKYSRLLEHGRYSSQGTGGLFKTQGSVLKKSQVEEGKRYHRILASYEKYHGLPIGKDPFR